jgi:hypothetical protein
MKRKVYSSLAELVADSRPCTNNYQGADQMDGWNGATLDQAKELAVTGWNAHLDATLDLVDSAVTSVETETPSTHFHTVYGTEGCDVDVDRYLAGEPECMISYPLVETPRVGRVITLCASIAYSASVDPPDMIRRGQVISALVLALSRMGLNTELWIDSTITSISNSNSNTVRCLVKSANDVLDMSKVLFAYAHPAMLRQLVFGVPTFSHGIPQPPKKDLPEGTIYLPEICKARGAPNADQELRKLLQDIGLAEGNQR